MARKYNFEQGWERKAGILFIDEIENHLHPSWQRRVIPALRKHFPGLQIFATTHSPFVVAGLKKGQVHKLYREGGVIKTPKLSEEEKEQRIVGWTVEEILREFMGVDDPTDEETAVAAAFLRWLLRQSSPDVSAEEWRKEKLTQLQDTSERTSDEEVALYWLERLGPFDGTAQQWMEDKIEELRSAVSPDLESGGPLAAQRELFMEQLAELLKETEDHETETEDADDLSF